MFPETFVREHLTISPYSGFVFDPFCGRGTTIFEALLQSREAAGCDVNPVAACISGAKCDPGEFSSIKERIIELRENVHEPNDGKWQGEMEEFFSLCFHPDTLRQIRYLRSTLKWKESQNDRFIAALCLAALHGESHRSPNYFSNRMPRTISTKPRYSIHWWRRNKYDPPNRDVFKILEHMLQFRFKSPPPMRTGKVIQADARGAEQVFASLKGQVTDVITSPPYLDTTNYREDQWLRLWFLGGPPKIVYVGGDDRYFNKDAYWTFIREAFSGISSLLAEHARIVIRIGGRRLKKEEFRLGLQQSLMESFGRDIYILDEGVTSEVIHTQANAFRGAKVSPVKEHDFCFVL